MAVGTIMSVTLDCAEPKPLADFWAAMLGGSVAFEGDEFTAVQTPAGFFLGVYRIDGFRPPNWPEADGTPKQFHLDLAVSDLDAAELEAQQLGAVKAEHQPNNDTFRVLFDPAGHPFCLTTASA